MTLIDSYEHAGVEVRIYLDDDPMNPRTEFDQIAKIVAWHGRYALGDVNVSRHFDSLEDLIQEHVTEDSLVRPLWLYEHSGLTISVGEAFVAGDNPFHCRWDSGLVGFVSVSAADIRKAWADPDMSDEDVFCKAWGLIDGEIAEYDAYLRGEVYGFVTDPDGEYVDSCWGFIGDEEGCKSEANASAEWAAKQYEAKKWEAHNTLFAYA